MSIFISARAVVFYLKNRAGAAVGRDPYGMFRSVSVARGARDTWRACRRAK